jgi:hypothetical protein
MVRLGREALNAEWFSIIKQAQIVINTWLKQYNKHEATGARNSTTKWCITRGLYNEYQHQN